MNELNIFKCDNATVNILEYKGHVKHDLITQISSGMVIQMRTKFKKNTKCK